MTYTRRYTQSLSQRRSRNYGYGKRFAQQGRPRFHGGTRLDHSLFIKPAEFQEVEVYTPRHRFDEFLINDEIKQSILKKGYVSPTPIQDQSIPYILEGKDLVGIANTGTGKTAAFLVPLIQKVITDRREKVLVIAPTRELAVQINDELRSLTPHMNIFSVLCIGGVNIIPQKRQLERMHNFVIGTPGRLKDLERQRKLYFQDYNSIVLDEVDRMLDMGFINDVRYIISKLANPRHSLFFSATLPPTVQGVMKEFLHNPVTVAVKTRETSANVDQNVVRMDGKEKIDVLHDLLIQEGFDKVLVFGRTKWGMEKLSRLLSQRGFRVAAIHGNKNQNQRQQAISEFKGNKVQVLLATDIASRGLDIPNVTHVINYDIPESYEDYVHRIGRTGRADKRGCALTFIE